MFSRWRLAGLAISISLCLATLMLWVRSYFYSDGLNYRSNQKAFWVTVGSSEGRLGVGFTRFINLPGMLATNSWGLYSYPVNQGWRFLTLRSLWGFEYDNRVNHLAGGATVHSWGVFVPTWIVFALSAVFPVWIYFRNRSLKITLLPRLGQDLSWSNPRLRLRVARFGVFSAAGIVAGAIVVSIDIRFPLIQAKYLWLTPWVLLPIVSLMAVYTRRRIPWHRAMLWMAPDLAGCVCFFQATIAKIWTHYHVYLFDIPDMLQYLLLTGGACFIVGAVLLLFLQVKPEPVKPGPYCPECGYCLIGLPRQICSECGRPFTLDELGVEADALKVAARRA